MASTILYLTFLCTVAILGLSIEGESRDFGIDTGIALRHESLHVIAQKNGQLWLNCSVVSERQYGTLHINWTKNGEPVNLDKRIQLVQNGSLFFRRVKHRPKRGHSDEGVYECHARNDVGTVIGRRVELQVANIAKSFTKEPEDLAVHVGGVARFRCEISAVPPPLFVWEKDRKPLPQNENRYTKLTSGILQINGVQIGDAGRYRCVTAHGALRELPAEVDHFGWKRSSEALFTVRQTSGNTASRIIAGPENVTVVAGDPVILECLVDGIPKPTVTWKRQDGGTIRTDKAIRVGGTNLKFLSIDPDDAGQYVCEAVSDEFRTVRAVGSITVQTPPMMEERPNSFEYPAARMARFKCLVAGNPKPKIVWLKNGQVLEKKENINLQEKGDLVITQTTENDSGYYQCVATNSVGRATAIARLKVSSTDDAPGPPQNVRAQALTSTTIRVVWEPAQAKTGFPVLAYSCHYSATNGQSVENNAVHTDTFVTLKALKPFTRYSIKVRAYSPKGASPYSTTVKARTLEDVPSKAPVISGATTNPTSIKVHWEPLSESESNGILTRYRIFFRHAGESAFHSDDILGTATSYTIRDLTPDTLYQIRMQAGTKHGFSQLAEAMWPWQEYRTSRKCVEACDGPQPPRIQVIPINATSVNVSWDTLGGDINTYQIYLHKMHDEEDKILTVNAPATYYIISSLENNTQYQVSVIASNNHGSSDPVLENFQTSENPGPPVPTQLHVNMKTATSINLSWQQPMSRVAVVSYTVRYFPWKGSETAETSTLVKHQTSDSLEALLEGLKPFTYYQFAVQAHSRHGVGEWSKPIIEHTREDVPSEPREVEVKVVSPGRVQIMWKPPAQPNGNITAYIVMYGLDPSGIWNTMKKNGTVHLATIEDLQGTVYYFKVTACTNAGQGPSSDLKTLAPMATGNTQKPAEQEQTESNNVNPKLGIIVGVTIGVVCIIICIIIVFFRNRCLAQNSSSSVQTVSHYHGNGHIPGQGNGHAARPADSSLEELHEMHGSYAPMLTQMPENMSCDSKGGGSGNLILTPNGTRFNGFVPLRNGTKNGQVPNGHVTTFISGSYPDNVKPEETQGLLEAMMAASDGSLLCERGENSENLVHSNKADMDSLDDIDKSVDDNDSERGCVKSDSQLSDTYLPPALESATKSSTANTNSQPIKLGTDREQGCQADMSCPQSLSPSLRTPTSCFMKQPTTSVNSFNSGRKLQGALPTAHRGSHPPPNPHSNSATQRVRDFGYITTLGDNGLPSGDQSNLPTPPSPYVGSAEVRFAALPQDAYSGHTPMSHREGWDEHSV